MPEVTVTVSGVTYKADTVATHVAVDVQEPKPEQPPVPNKARKTS